MNETVRFTFDGQAISFEFSDGSRMINATEMAKPFKGKLVADFLRLKNTKEFISELEKRYGNSHIAQYEVLRVVRGGDPTLQGTWMDEHLALKFAAWLSPRFEVWVYQKIKELLTQGQASLDVKPGGFAQTLRLLAEQWEKQDKINEGVREELDITANRLDELEAKITSTDENYYTIAGYCALHRIPCPLNQAKTWGKVATARSSALGVPTGTAHDERYGRVRTYHRDVLQDVIGP